MVGGESQELVGEFDDSALRQSHPNSLVNQTLTPLHGNRGGILVNDDQDNSDFEGSQPGPNNIPGVISPFNNDSYNNPNVR